MLILPGANHVDLYDNLSVIPFDKIEAFKKGFLAYIEEKNPELHDLVKADTALTAELKDKIVALAQSYKASAELR